MPTNDRLSWCDDCQREHSAGMPCDREFARTERRRLFGLAFREVVQMTITLVVGLLLSLIVAAVIYGLFVLLRRVFS